MTDSLLFFLCFLYLAQSLAKLVGTRSRSVSASDAFQSFDDIVNLHSLHQFSDTLKVPVASSPKVELGYDTVFYLQFDVATTSTLRLVSKFLDHYSSAGFIKLFIITVSILFYYLCCKINQKFYFYNEKSSIIIEM